MAATLCPASGGTCSPNGAPPPLLMLLAPSGADLGVGVGVHLEGPREPEGRQRQVCPVTVAVTMATDSPAEATACPPTVCGSGGRFSASLGLERGGRASAHGALPGGLVGSLLSLTELLWNPGPICWPAVAWATLTPPGPLSGPCSGPRGRQPAAVTAPGVTPGVTPAGPAPSSHLGEVSLPSGAQLLCTGPTRSPRLMPGPCSLWPWSHLRLSLAICKGSRI